MMRLIKKNNSRFKTVSGVMIAFLLFFLFSAALSADPIEGKWKTIDDETGKVKSIVKIWISKSGKLQGKILQLFNSDDGPDPICTACKDSWNKGKHVKGLTILWGMKKDPDEDGLWKGGTIMDPKNGKHYTCKIWYQGNKLKVRGYIAFFYRTQYWYKVK